MAMLICSIRFFKNKKRTALLIAGATQTLFVLLKTGFILLLYSYLTEKKIIMNIKIQHHPSKIQYPSTRS